MLVDEYTKKPYGTGVGEWRKEVMLMSRKLDPAIGQINKQAHDVLLEITEWIQHTWEYSEPIKFEVVKEVIAPGVSLRRAELWKKLRREEPKPDVSDRTWRSLKRELESSTTQRKMQNCSKANASRVNFGQTGPSGEVGVREILRKHFKRSPEPHELSFEMARDKGYGERSKQLKNNDNVMHGNELTSPVPLEVARITDAFGTEYVDNEEDVSNAPAASDSRVQLQNGMGCEATAKNGNTTSGGIHNMSAEELQSNPFVMELMQRIAALEGSQSTAEDQVLVVTAKNTCTNVAADSMDHGVGAVHVTSIKVSPSRS